MVHSDPDHSLPNVEIWFDDGWYWQPCFPGCLPDGDPIGPFRTFLDAVADARDEW